ncbi:hypothetical protein L6164_001508 [Bauhinia variegata]|uniref:Uncharacterized protein n=1 Tax=Bauhinia variegata TaxID=167791 RepID=A0ACB9Q920_BAUVA|nr:hypothetical protein L6164_001508 [Bauhinia variegata]
MTGLLARFSFKCISIESPPLDVQLHNHIVLVWLHPLESAKKFCKSNFQEKFSHLYIHILQDAIFIGSMAKKAHIDNSLMSEIDEQQLAILTNSFLDAGSRPLLMNLKNSTTSVILVKGFWVLLWLWS